MRTILAIIAWGATITIILLELESWWVAGEKFWVFVAFFSGVGWVVAWLIGVFHLLFINWVVGGVYIALVAYYLFGGRNDY